MFCLLLRCFVLLQYSLYVPTCFCVLICCIVILQRYNIILYIIIMCRVLCVIILFLCLVILFCNVILLFYNVTMLLSVMLCRFVMLYHSFVSYNVALCLVMLFCNVTTLFYKFQYCFMYYYVV